MAVAFGQVVRPVEPEVPAGWFVVAARIGTAYYFFHFLILLPLLGKMERPRPLPASIGAAVLKGGAVSAE